MSRSMIAFERPTLDPEIRPAYVRLPDAVRVHAWAGKMRLVVRITREAVEQRLLLDRPAQWRDLDALWPEIEQAAEELILAGRFETERDPRTDLPVVSIARQQLPARAPHADTTGLRR